MNAGETKQTGYSRQSTNELKQTVGQNAEIPDSERQVYKSFPQSGAGRNF